MERCATQRLQVVLDHLKGQPVSARQLQVRSGAQQVLPDDVVVVHGRRTAITRGNRGGFKVRLWVWAPGRVGFWLLCSVPFDAGGGSAPEL